MDVIESLSWRYATKQFDSSKKISPELYTDIEEILCLTPSAFGIQPWKFLIIRDISIREKLKIASWNQSQITESDSIIVFCRQDKMDEAYVESYIKRVVDVRGIDATQLVDYKKMVIEKLTHRTENEYKNWANNQVYIALGNFLTAASLKGIDTCPIEGFIPEKYNEILALSQKGLASVVVCAMGYRSKDDKYAKMKKVRFEKEKLIEYI